MRQPKCISEGEGFFHIRLHLSSLCVDSAGGATMLRGGKGIVSLEYYANGEL